MSEQLDYEADDRDEVIDAVKASYVSRFYVEFLQQGGPKPHVVLRLNINPTVKIGRDTYKGCRLAMDLEGGLGGVFHISPLPYNDTSHAAHAAFEFELRALNWTVDNVLAAAMYPNDLLGFSFTGGFRVPGEATEYVDGCRDFISQIFIILHRSGLVSWHVHRIDRGVFNDANFVVREGRTGFHEIIGYNYRNPSDGSNSTVVGSLPLARGTFIDPAFRRVINYQISDRHQHQLPYHPVDLQEGDEGYQEWSEWSEWRWSTQYNCYERYRYGPNGQVEYGYLANA